MARHVQRSRESGCDGTFLGVSLGMWVVPRTYGPHFQSCYPRTGFRGLGVEELCTCASSFESRQRERESLARRESRARQLKMDEARTRERLQAEIAPIIEQVRGARASKNWRLADALVAGLRARGITVQVDRDSIRWYQ